MKKSVKIMAIMVIMAILISIVGSVNAYSVNGTLTSSSKLKVGDTVKVTFSLTSVDAGEGIIGIGATLKYDEDVFETVARSNFKMANDWETPTYNPDNKSFTITRDPFDPITTAGEVFTLELKVKDSISKDSTKVELLGPIDTGTGEIKAEGIELSGGAETGDLYIANLSVTIAKDATQEPTNTNPTTPTTPSTTTNTTKTNTTNTTATGKLPQTGEGTTAIVVSAAVVAVIAGLAFMRYRKIEIK